MQYEDYIKNSLFTIFCLLKNNFEIQFLVGGAKRRAIYKLKWNFQNVEQLILIINQ